MFDYRFIWQSFNALHAANTTQHLLHKCYEKTAVPNADKKSYENSYPFIYYLEHGQNYYQLSQNAPLSIKPVLLFYGMVQLLKACLLTVDPQYPESTSVLAHGVSTRKRKKQSYEFFHDEVKVQKNGLFSHFSERMFHVKQIEGEKFTMEQLFKRIPELQNLFTLHFQQQLYLKTHITGENTLLIPEEALDSYHMTSRRFLDFITQALPFPTSHSTEESDDKDRNQLSLKVDKPNFLLPLASSPLLYHLYEDTYYLPKERELLSFFPEIMTHYLLLYNLSMISRYETEWWSELLHSYSSNDYPFIRQFLAVSADKVPFLLYLFLKEKIDGV
ncbi:YaaC family protein [Bacillus sp. REN16]|uniref:YaaC family protein n=1 Tax=Bacillus sp. REN16 TaxID=2887296 RepID=UPI001E655FE1|nr:YaaC family protein [Bacillus sp. REN16]MCC3359571.1 YaaC family protein [Bacillus sp. REN16]